jgi:hypothetical protein
MNAKKSINMFTQCEYKNDVVREKFARVNNGKEIKFEERFVKPCIKFHDFKHLPKKKIESRKKNESDEKCKTARRTLFTCVAELRFSVRGECHAKIRNKQQKKNPELTFFFTFMHTRVKQNKDYA